MADPHGLVMLTTFILRPRPRVYAWEHIVLDAVARQADFANRRVLQRAVNIVLGGMEATLDEVEDILAAKKAKKFVPQRGQSEIAQMCRVVADRRNELIAEARKRAGMSMTEPSTPRKRVRLYLPRGLRYVPTSEPGLKVLARV